MSGSILHLVLETPGCDSLDVLRKGTEDDSPPPLFLLPPEISHPQRGATLAGDLIQKRVPLTFA